jgi:protein-tyrosine phosphatase
MIDLHTHILPGLDDGAKTLEESIQMCWVGYRDGIRTIVATPHTLNGVYQNDRSRILSKVQELHTALNSSLFTPHSSLPLRVLPGADVHFCKEILLQLSQGRLITIGDGGKFLLIEFPFQGIPYRTEEILFQLLAKGMVPIISHPERNMDIGQRPKQYYEMIQMGCLGQVTAMSLTGEFGSKVRQVAEKLLSNKLIHFIASDAHSINGRPPILSEAVKAAKKIVGEEEAQKMVTEYPQAILQGQRPKFPDPIPP